MATRLEGNDQLHVERDAVKSLRGSVWVAVVLLAGCGTTYHMGDPLRPDPKARVEDSASSQYRNDSAQRRADDWESKWQQIQKPGDTVQWTDHFHVCGLKYRFRNYDQFFRCLDLLDAKIAAGGPRVPKPELVRAGAPVMIGWLRATAYAELGEPETALKWAESAWSALPEAFRVADSRVTVSGYFGGVPKDLMPIYWVAGSLGSGGFGMGVTEVEEDVLREGRNNPEAFDFRVPMVTMALAVQRSLLYRRLGRMQDAQAAFADLKRWEDAHWIGPGFAGFGHKTSKIRPFVGEAQLLSIGPLFAEGDYDSVVFYYEALAKQVGARRTRESASQTLNWTLFLPVTLLQKAIQAPIYKALLPADARLFSLAVEDASNGLIYAQSLSRLRKVEQARTMLDTLLALPEIRAMGNLYWVALYERGVIALGQGQRDEGIRFLTQSVDAIESVRQTISFEAAKIGFAGDKQAVYAALIGALAASGDWPQAFLYAERAKARALVDLLAERRDLAPPPSADDKVRELFAHATTLDGSVGLATSENTVRGIQVIADARDTLAHVAPEAGSLISVQKVDIAAITSRLDANESLIDYYAQGDELYAFVLSAGSITGRKLSGAGLTEEVRAFREAIQRRDGRAMDRGRQLYARLVQPLLPDLKGTKLTIAPHGVLHYLPFAALSDTDGYLIDRYGLRLIPSADTLVYLRAGEPKKAGRLLALGNPDLGDRRLDLPNAQTEATTLAAMFPDSRALVRADASKSAVKELGNGFAMLHFATHGRFDADAPLASGLYLAKGRDAEGVLTVSELYSLRWDVDLVTLSACETGLGKIASGDDVIGLTRGFFYAGARSIVASLWQVDDAATAQLMESFYRNLANHDKREALRLAQIETRERYREPWFWAAFNLLGRAD